MFQLAEPTTQANLKGYTVRELERIRDKIIRRTYRDNAGGNLYGMDAATFRIIFPARYAMCKAIAKELQLRK